MDFFFPVAQMEPSEEVRIWPVVSTGRWLSQLQRLQIFEQSSVIMLLAVERGWVGNIWRDVLAGEID